ncbi:MAG TPA: hypothetical protein PK453_24295 [Leptospiraceae bacterium]|nr:hypothetical protein [Leptospiraceae bacterium]HNM05824.1 hypothetical protein [Leptospiraceae bacterium]
MKALIQLNNVPSVVMMANNKGRSVAMFGCPVRTVSGHFQPTGQSIPLDFRRLNKPQTVYHAKLIHNGKEYVFFVNERHIQNGKNVTYQYDIVCKLGRGSK